MCLNRRQLSSAPSRAEYFFWQNHSTVTDLNKTVIWFLQNKLAKEIPRRVVITNNIIGRIIIVTIKNIITDLKIAKKLISVTFTEIISSCSFLLDFFLVVFQGSSFILNHCFLLLHCSRVFLTQPIFNISFFVVLLF